MESTPSFRDRYYGAASSTPQRVFRIPVCKNSEDHLATLPQRPWRQVGEEPAATGGWLDRQIGEIYGRASRARCPSSLTLEAQSHFAIGYYHEKYARRDDVPDDLKSVEPETDDRGRCTAND